jgi:hypothetical protein
MSHVPDAKYQRTDETRHKGAAERVSCAEAIMLRIAFCFLLLITALLLAGAGEIARLIYPPAAVILATWFFVKKREFYFDLVLWCWFLSPFLRRVMDYEAGWKDPSFVLLTPFLVTIVAPLIGVRRFTDRSFQESAPFVLALFAIACGVAFGLFHGSTIEMATPLTDWSVPVLFAWWLYSTTDRDRADALLSIERSFFAGVLVMGVYGVIQYVFAPAWDTNWLIQLSAIADVHSMGTPQPYGMRVFSTLNSSGVFALVLACGLLILVQSRRKLAPVAAIFGCVSLLLTLGRSAWLTLTIGLALLLFLMPKKVLRAIAIPGIIVFLAFSLASLSPARDLIGDRFSSFSRLREDASADDRLTGTLRAGQLLFNQPEGYGLGVPQDLIASDGSFSLNDNGFANGFLSLGLLPGLLYFGSLAILLAKSFRNFRHKSTEARVLAVAAVAIAAQLPLDTAYLGPTGILLWMFSSLASRAEYSHSLAEDLDRSDFPPVLTGPGGITGILGTGKETVGAQFRQ